MRRRVDVVEDVLRQLEEDSLRVRGRPLMPAERGVVGDNVERVHGRVRVVQVVALALAATAAFVAARRRRTSV